MAKQVVQCTLDGQERIPGSSDGSIFFIGDVPRTTTWLHPKLAVVGGVVQLKHPDTGKSYRWQVVARGAQRRVDDHGRFLYGS